MYTSENRKLYPSSNNFIQILLYFIEIIRSRNDPSMNPRFFSLISIQEDKFYGSFYQLTSIIQWSQVINESKNIFKVPGHFSFFDFINAFFLIILEKQIHRKRSRIQSHGNCNYLLNYFISKFNQTITSNNFTFCLGAAFVNVNEYSL